MPLSIELCPGVSTVSIRQRQSSAASRSIHSSGQSESEHSDLDPSHHLPVRLRQLTVSTQTERLWPVIRTQYFAATSAVVRSGFTDTVPKSISVPMLRLAGRSATLALSSTILAEHHQDTRRTTPPPRRNPCFSRDESRIGQLSAAADRGAQGFALRGAESSTWMSTNCLSRRSVRRPYEIWRRSPSALDLTKQLTYQLPRIECPLGSSSELGLGLCWSLP